MGANASDRVKFAPMTPKALTVCAALTLCACAHPLPPHWAEGGAPLELKAAHWDRNDDDPVDIDPQGRVLEGGTLRFQLDRTGRITDDEGDPVAILFPEGDVVGPANQYFGRVGVANAAPPHANTAWVAVLPDGGVMRFADDGERIPDGRWIGCEGAMHRTCTLISHVMLLRHYHHPRPRIGIGVMVAY